MYRGCSGPTARRREDVEKERIVHCGHFQASADAIGAVGGMAFYMAK